MKHLIFENEQSCRRHDCCHVIGASVCAAHCHGDSWLILLKKIHLLISWVAVRTYCQLPFLKDIFRRTWAHSTTLWGIVIFPAIIRSPAGAAMTHSEIDMTGLSGQPAMICRASDRPPPWARSASHETEQMLCPSANHRRASRKRWHHRQIRAHAVSLMVVVSSCVQPAASSYSNSAGW